MLHLNVPEQRRGRDPGWQGSLKWYHQSLGSALKWSIVTLLVPELIFSKAIGDLVNATHQLRLLHLDFPQAVTSVNLTHMIFADMGGFALDCRLTSD